MRGSEGRLLARTGKFDRNCWHIFLRRSRQQYPMFSFWPGF